MRASLLEVRDHTERLGRDPSEPRDLLCFPLAETTQHGPPRLSVLFSETSDEVARLLSKILVFRMMLITQSLKPTTPEGTRVLTPKERPQRENQEGCHAGQGDLLASGDSGVGCVDF